ncbi:hypothetical protein EP331_07120 [bacterium]|nr:MAG: hypothetical protein EP331_07120 [bacterium]
MMNGFLHTKREGLIQIGLILGILICLNYLADSFIVRLDLTDDKRYTLSEASEDIAKSVMNPITVEGYFSEGLPPQLSEVQRQFRDFLDEYRAYSGGNIEYTFLNPSENEQVEQQTQQKGIQPILIDVRERDQVSQKRAYLGAIFKYGEKQEVIPYIQPGAAMEYTISSTIKRLTAQLKPTIGLLDAGGSATLQEMPQLAQVLSQQYEIETLSGLDTTDVPANIEVVLVVRPTQELSTNVLKALDQHLMRGGKLVYAINRVNTNIQAGQASVLNTGIENLLAAYKTPINGDLLRDVNANSIGVRQQRGMIQFVNQVRYPYLPLISNFGEHPISSGLETVILNFTSTIDLTLADTTIKVTGLAFSSDRSGTARGFFDINPFQEWQESQFNERHLPVAALVEGQFNSAFADNDSVFVPMKRSSKTAYVVIGDGDLVVNGSGEQAQMMPEDNINLVANAVDYLADDTGLLTLRTKGITNRPLEQIEEGTKTTIKYANVFVPILLVIVYGLFRMQRRKAQRRAWLEKGV